MMKWLIISLLSVSCFAQTVNVTATHITDGGTLLGNGTICFTPINPASAGFGLTGVGQQTGTPFCASVTDGAISNPFLVPDIALTAPQNICYAVSIKNTVTGRYVLGVGQGNSYGCVQPTGDTFDFDAFVPSTLVLQLGQSITNLHIQNAVIDNCTGAGCGSGGGGAVDSVFGRTGAVTAHTGDYSYSQISGTPTLATVATSGAYSDLTGKPTIPAAQVNVDWNSLSGITQILNKPALATVATTGAYTDLSGKPSLATVATSGSYTDLSSKPTIPAGPPYAESDITNLVSDLAGKQPLFVVPTFSNTGYPNSFTNLPSGSTATIVNSSNGIALAETDYGADNLNLSCKTAPATPYTESIHVALSTDIGTSNSSFGLAWRDTTNGHLDTLWMSPTSNSPKLAGALFEITWSDSTTAVGSNASMLAGVASLWLQIDSDGTVFHMRFSTAQTDTVPDASQFIRLFGGTIGSGDYLGVGGYNQVCVFISAHGAAAAALILGYSETSP